MIWISVSYIKIYEKNLARNSLRKATPFSGRLGYLFLLINLLVAFNPIDLDGSNLLVNSNSSSRGGFVSVKSGDTFNSHGISFLISSTVIHG
jgi:hypothetical protein